MGKNAYLIVTDLHLSYKNLRNRISYREEIESVFRELMTVAEKYVAAGYKINLLLLGDVFHRSYNSIFNACVDTSFFYMWRQRYGHIYSVLGNHELSYYQSNPFYTLVSDIKSERVRMIMNRVWHPVGTQNVIEIVDELQDGEVNFVFNHFSTGVAPVQPGMKNIGLFHSEIVSGEILQSSDMQSGISTFAHPIDIENSGIVSDYDYCFFGHMHTVYGTFIADNGTTLCYLASLGRTNTLEVNDRFLERNIPAILVEDGVFIKAEDNLFNLPERAACVKESAVTEAHEKAEVQREVTEIKRTISLGDDPVRNTQALLAADELSLSIFNDIIATGSDSYGQELVKEMMLAAQEQVF